MPHAKLMRLVPLSLGILLLLGLFLGTNGPSETGIASEKSSKVRTADPASLTLPQQKSLRRPAALAAIPEEGRLFVANQRSGSISLVDLTRRETIREFPVGEKLSALILFPDKKHLAALDEAKNRLLIFAREGDELLPRGELPLPASPVAMTILDEGRLLCVSSLWARQLTLVDVSPPSLKIRHTISLSFAPREQIYLPKEKLLLVTDAFGGKMAFVDPRSGEIRLERELPASNIRGLTLTPDGKKLLVSHQILNGLAQTTNNDVHWGILLSNVLRWLSLETLLDPKQEILKQSHVHPAGDTGSPGGDPSGLAVTSDGTVLMALSGVGKVALGKEDDFSLRQIHVGTRPTVSCIDDDERTVYLADTFNDELVVLDLVSEKVIGRISLGPKADLSLVDRGELLFYSSRLSLNGWFSCHSCHTDGHTIGQLTDNLGDGVFGDAKRVLTLRGVKDSAPWAWNGSQNRLEDQVHKSITQTMQGSPPSPEQVAALVAFMKSLSPPPSLSKSRGENDSLTIARGQALFAKIGCAECHRAPTYTSEETYDVGLSDKLGNKQFNPPSLRGVSQGGPYFHDGRAATLEEVFIKHKHQLPADFSPEQVKDLLTFLRSL